MKRGGLLPPCPHLLKSLGGLLIELAGLGVPPLEVGQAPQLVKRLRDASAIAEFLCNFERPLIETLGFSVGPLLLCQYPSLCSI